MKNFGKADNSKEHDYVIADTILNSYESPEWEKDLKATLENMLFEIYIAGGEEAAQTLNDSSDIAEHFTVDQTFHEYATQYSEERAAELVGTGKNPAYSIDSSTRQMLRNDLVNMMEEGLTPKEIADQIQNNYAFSERRSMTIARTETGFTWNRSTITMYSGAGVKNVYVHDGDYDEDCRAANGQIWSVEYASINALQHPNCVRSFSPCMDPSAEPDEY